MEKIKSIEEFNEAIEKLNLRFENFAKSLILIAENFNTNLENYFKDCKEFIDEKIDEEIEKTN